MAGLSLKFRLDRQDIIRLADLLEAGLLTPPITALSLRDHFATTHAESVAQCIKKLGNEGVPPNQVSVVLRAFVAGAQTAAKHSLTVEIVTSGPDATGSARDTGVVVRQLFAKAQKRVLAVGFAVHQGKAVFKVLADRLDSNSSLEAILCIDVRRQFGDTSIDRDILRRFAIEFVHNEWPGTRLPCVYYDPRSLKATGVTASSMHAKCVVANGREALVTSANFTEAEQTRNIELGLLVKSEPIVRKVEGHFISLIDNGSLSRLVLS